MPGRRAPAERQRTNQRDEPRGSHHRGYHGVRGEEKRKDYFIITQNK